MKNRDNPCAESTDGHIVKKVPHCLFVVQPTSIQHKPGISESLVLQQVFLNFCFWEWSVNKALKQRKKLELSVTKDNTCWTTRGKRSLACRTWISKEGFHNYDWTMDCSTCMWEMETRQIKFKTAIDEQKLQEWHHWLQQKKYHII